MKLSGSPPKKAICPSGAKTRRMSLKRWKRYSLYCPPRYIVTTWQAASGSVAPHSSSIALMALARWLAAVLASAVGAAARVTRSVTSVMACSWSRKSPWQARSSSRLPA